VLNERSSETVTARSEVLCIRHGLTGWNAVQRWQGRANIGLAVEGVDQAKRAALVVAQMVPGFDVLGCSPLDRARKTAELIGAQIGLRVSAIDDRWMERDIGEWSGLTTPEIESRWPGMLAAWRNDGIDQLPGGEREIEMTQRVTGALTDLLRSLHQIPNGGRALVVTHGGVLHTLANAYGVAPRRFDNLDGQWFSLENHEGATVQPGEGVRLNTDASQHRGAATGNAL
jgi:glucosyl-3-phosphoglycerate phosphatase